MQNNSSFNILATILILIGGIFLLENFGIIQGAWLFWPLIPLIIGAGFCMLYFRTRRDTILLGLGSFITLNSILFFYLNMTRWSLLAHQWPLFIVIMGLTSLICFIFSRNRVLLYIAVILIALGISFMLIFAVSTRLWPITLILAGVSFIIINLFERLGSRKKKHAKKK